MRITKRHEYKYHLQLAQIYQVRNEILGLDMELDEYSRDTGYVVRSLYFDTEDYRICQDNMGGLWGRVKLR